MDKALIDAVTEQWVPDVGGKKGRGAHRAEPPKKSFWKELPILLLVAFLLTFVIQTFVARVYVIPSSSMEQTLHGCTGCTGDRVLVDKVTYTFTNPEPGDVVVFKGPDAWTENEEVAPKSSNFFVRALQALGSVVGMAPPDEKDFVKRVIATEGQTVQCCDEKNRVLVDGKPVTEPYIYYEPGKGSKQATFEPVKVPKGKVWVLGDNRNNSCDSRCQGQGPRELVGVVPVDNVIGKARLIVLPPSRWGSIKAQNGQQAVAIGAPDWQRGVPAGVGFLGAWPTLWVTRRFNLVARWRAGLPKGRKRSL